MSFTPAPEPAPAAAAPQAAAAAVSAPVPLTPEQQRLATALDAALPQTQCTRCGYPDCRAYAEAMARGDVDTNRCPPGGQAGVIRLAAIRRTPPLPLDPVCGPEGPRAVARIDETWCIGCTLCIKACPVDCIVGASKVMHTIIEDLCTGCELCVPVCPVDCISLIPVTGERTGWDAWSPAEAERARERYAFHQFRTEREAREHDERLQAKAASKLADLGAHSQLTEPEDLDAKRAVIQAALQRAAAKRQAQAERFSPPAAPTRSDEPKA